MRTFLPVFLLAVSASAFAAPNVANTTQKGSLLIFPDIRVDQGWNTLIRIENDGGHDVDVLCFWMDGNKNRVDFLLPVTKNQPYWFDAQTGHGTYQVNQSPQQLANEIDDPLLRGVHAPSRSGLLGCWAVSVGAAYR